VFKDFASTKQKPLKQGGAIRLNCIPSSGRLEIEADMVHRGQRRPFGSPGSATLLSEAYGRIHPRCIGGNLTMDIDDAIRAADLLQGKDVMGVHYDTFPLIKIDHAAAKEKFRSKGLDLAPASHWRHAGFLSARLPAFDDKRGSWD
jgi:hypothetical protein